MLGRIARWFDSTTHPEWYHGAEKQPPFFEGWYFKMVNADRSLRYAVIPGIFISDDPAQHHAFVQVFDGLSGQATYHRYPASDFQAEPGFFDVRIGKNRFRLDRIELDIDDDLRTVSGTLAFGDSLGWPVSAVSPGTMGPFGWLPIMECYHGVLKFDHEVTGRLTVDGEPLDFTGGRGYVEKDWGKSFPAGWVWMQTNHFSRTGISFSASVAVVPLLGGWFPGFLAGVSIDGVRHVFATYTGARSTKLEVTDDHVLWVLEDNSKRLEIFATRADATLLPGPNRHDMGTRVPETLKATIHVKLTEHGASVALLDDTGECAGLEVAGDVDRLRAAINA
ncbi:MAG: hypothetical protein KME04_04790 [Pleurocapsa minor GSE-CHR-MK-17-07R]|jgi:hypothetical protein|nr:hypothetical protein [Pleurocapsa minor GSE-CHR-MK 17-07R]